MIKNLVITLLLNLFLTSTVTFAVPFYRAPSVFYNTFYNYYFGIEAQDNAFKYSDELKELTFSGFKPISKKWGPGGGFFVGFYLCKNFALETGANIMSSIKGSWDESGIIDGVAFRNAGTIRILNLNAYFDLLGYVPIGCNIDLLGSVGIGILASQVDLLPSPFSTIPIGSLSPTIINGSNSKANMRVGAGIQYKFTKHFGSRLKFCYQKGNDVIVANRQVSLGLFYQSK